MNGVFITVEGPDGAGKTTVIKELSKLIQQNSNRSLTVTREPGGIPISEEIRQVILDPKNTEMDERTEALLYAAARRQHLVEKVLPAKEAGNLILCDRFIDSSIAYQGAGREIGEEEVLKINEFAIEGNYPDLTIYLDVPSEVGIDRINKSRKGDELDRLDRESLAFHEKVRESYLRLVQVNSKRIVLIDAQDNIEKVVKNCYDLIKERYPLFFN
ncbi:dTMP kinase [Vagococcus carniphilus]|uniref:Thymidylate kinase n=1 Tax=Vagococcus carniphilus TaxID=218144 RepID=A0AAW8UBT7_9ENTE|nr:dTMP kinase [Vagococcus carniphilus]MDT2816072.1 dTMP kinase [Vagococcus carniphilus]MDT2830847.1 dTMP kinase [Vagococcus carniphilus]MDT2834460.1 dTMP kinase [Vagococcus carniphilus]MDT2839381.1 dTMP kinase [Vagococcus carniphilus]MDT2848600.1 dTMP kinase [Vagococcus carniphilus]